MGLLKVWFPLNAEGFGPLERMEPCRIPVPRVRADVVRVGQVHGRGVTRSPASIILIEQLAASSSAFTSLSIGSPETHAESGLGE